MKMPADRKWYTAVRFHSNSGRQHARTHERDRSLQHIVAASPNAGDRRPRQHRGYDANTVVRSSVSLLHEHPRPTHVVSAGQLERIDVPIRTRARLADDVAQSVCLHDAERALGVADRPAAREKNDSAANARSHWLDVPGSVGVSDIAIVGHGDHWH